jgi:transposase
LRVAPEGQISLTDPDVRSMNSDGSGIVGYNVQAAVESERHLIVAHEVVTTDSDHAQLSRMASAAKAAMEGKSIEVVADRDYFSGPGILSCQEAGVSAHMV